MALLDDLNARLAPHTEKLAQTLHHGMRRIEDRISDLGKPDVGDLFLHVNVKAKLKGEPQPLRAQVGGRGEAGPMPGEIWLFQCMCVNGAALLSPAFTIRTNTGRLIASVVKEGMGMETPGGDVPILFGEELILIPAAEGEFDFTITFKRILTPRPPANAIGGVSGERADRPAHGVELAERQMQQVPNDPESPWFSHVTPDGLPGSEDYGGSIDRDAVLAGEPIDTDPET